MNTDDMIRALPYWKTKDGKLTMIKNMKTRELKKQNNIENAVRKARGGD